MSTEAMRAALAELVVCMDSNVISTSRWHDAWVAARAALAQRADEPVASFSEHEHGCSTHYHARAKCDCRISAPAAPAYVPLSNEDINNVMNACLNDWDWQAFARAIEALVVARMRGEGK